MSLCAEILRLHGAQWKIESEEGQGTCIYLHFPGKEEAEKDTESIGLLSLVALAAIAAVKLPDWIAAGGKDAGVVVVDDTTDQSGSRSVRTYEDTLKILASGAESTKLFETKSLDQLLKYDESFMKKLEKQLSQFAKIKGLVFLSPKNS